jgi:hypothetical protein
MESRSAADIHGPWVDPGFDSGLVERVRRSWTTPIGDLTNGTLATFLRQRLATEAVVREARKRLDAGYDDDSELYDGELAAALQDVRDHPERVPAR